MIWDLQSVNYIRDNVDKMKIKDIARHFNCTDTTICNVIKRFSIDRNEVLVKMRKGFSFSEKSEQGRKEYAERKGIDGRV